LRFLGFTNRYNAIRQRLDRCTHESPPIYYVPTL
jgi:hypothetical protein